MAGTRPDPHGVEMTPLLSREGFARERAPELASMRFEVEIAG